MNTLLQQKIEMGQSVKLFSNENHSLIISTLNNRVLFTDNQNGENWESFEKSDIDLILGTIFKYEKQGYKLIL